MTQLPNQKIKVKYKIKRKSKNPKWKSILNKLILVCI